ncbi:MAG: glycosyltransferase [Pseudonocardiales bacterium]|nr:glycosyltransferase [Pseudonocardiales bacterium]MBV9650342.1 glycosyltransferase [Pseudonocardiales bacterium]
MRIHIIGTRGYPSTYGGFETLVRHLAPYLVGHGHTVTVFDRDHGRRASGHRARSIDGVRVYSSRGFEGVRSSTLSHGLTSSVVAAKERPDVVLAMNVANGFFLPILRARRVPVVFNVDGIEWERDKWSPLGKFVFFTAARATARWADALIADSLAIAERWRQDFGRTSTFVPYGGDPRTERPNSDRVVELGLKPGQYVLIVARLVPENNVTTMLDAAKASGAPTVVVGSGGGTALEKSVFAQHDPPRVLTLGHVADQGLLAALWAHCGVYLHGHSVGGTNPALVQALGLGAPVLAYGTVFNREVLVREEMLVSLDIESIVSRIHELLSSDALRTSFAEWGRSRVAEMYNWEAVCARYEAVLRGIARLE